MTAIFQQYLDVLMLKTEAFEALRDARNGLVQAMRLFVLVGLFAGLGSCASGLRPPPSMESIGPQIDQFIDLWGQVSNLPPRETQVMGELFKRFAEVFLRIASTPPVIGELPARLLAAFGSWLGTPFRWLAIGFNYTLAVLLAAKLLGGTGTLAQHFSLTVLFATPFALMVFSFVPYCSPVLALVAFLWGLAIYIKGIAIANQLDLGRAIVAWIAPTVTMIVLWAMLTGFAFGLSFLVGRLAS